MACGAQGGKEEEHRRAWERMGEEERRLGGRKARIIRGAVRVAEGRTEGQGMPRGGEAQAVEELQRAWAILWRRLERVERAERESEQPRELAQGGGGLECRPPLQPFRQPAIPPEQEREMQERAWGQIRGEAARLAERDREVTARERRVLEEEEALAKGGHTGSSRTQKGTSPPGMRRDICCPGRGPDEKEGRLGKQGESGARCMGVEQGRQRGRRGSPAPARSQRRRTGTQSRRRCGNMRCSRCRESPGWSGGGGRGMWRSWSAT